MYAKHKIVFLYIKDALVGVINEQYTSHSIKMHGLNNVKKREEECIWGGDPPSNSTPDIHAVCPHIEPVSTSVWQLSSPASYFCVQLQKIFY
jgi:hypothetical protein